MKSLSPCATMFPVIDGAVVTISRDHGSDRAVDLVGVTVVVDVVDVGGRAGRHRRSRSTTRFGSDLLASSDMLPA